MDFPTSIPDRFAAGTTLEYRRSLAAFPCSDGWALTLYLAGPSTLEVEASVDGEEFVVRAEADDTTALLPGTYQWAEVVVHDTYGTKEAARGTVFVTPNIAEAEDGALSVWAETAVLLLEARISGRLTDGQDVESVQVLGRAVSLLPLREAVGLRRDLIREVIRKRDGGPKPVYFRFGGRVQA